MKLIVLLAALLVLPAAAQTRSLRAEVLFRLAIPCPATAEAYGPCKGYVINRVIPLVCGGAEEPANMQWQTLAQAKEKSKWDRIGCRSGRKLVLPQTSSVVTEAFSLTAPEPITEVKPLPLQ